MEAKDGASGRVDIESLEGWLFKEKARGSRWTIPGDNKRWFKVQRVEGSEDDGELALCYYKNASSKEPRGWVFLKDVVEITEEAEDSRPGIVIVHPARTLRLRASTRAEHRLWFSSVKQIVLDVQAEAKFSSDAKSDSDGPGDKETEKKADFGELERHPESMASLDESSSVRRREPPQEDVLDAKDDTGARDRLHVREEQTIAGGRESQFRVERKKEERQAPSMGTSATNRLHDHISRCPDTPHPAFDPRTAINHRRKPVSPGFHSVSDEEDDEEEEEEEHDAREAGAIRAAAQEPGPPHTEAKEQELKQSPRQPEVPQQAVEARIDEQDEDAEEVVLDSETKPSATCFKSHPAPAVRNGFLAQNTVDGAREAKVDDDSKQAVDAALERTESQRHPPRRLADDQDAAVTSEPKSQDETGTEKPQERKIALDDDDDEDEGHDLIEKEKQRLAKKKSQAAQAEKRGKKTKRRPPPPAGAPPPQAIAADEDFLERDWDDESKV